jgi:hypothetical protein
VNRSWQGQTLRGFKSHFHLFYIDAETAIRGSEIWSRDGNPERKIRG